MTYRHPWVPNYQEQLSAGRALAQDIRGARYWLATHSGGCGESRWAECATEKKPITSQWWNEGFSGK